MVIPALGPGPAVYTGLTALTCTHLPSSPRSRYFLRDTRTPVPKGYMETWEKVVIRKSQWKHFREGTIKSIWVCGTDKAKMTISEMNQTHVPGRTLNKAFPCPGLTEK